MDIVDIVRARLRDGRPIGDAYVADLISRIEALEAQVAAADALAVIAQIIHDKCAHPTEGVTIIDQKKLELVLGEYNEAKKGPTE